MAIAVNVRLKMFQEAGAQITPGQTRCSQKQQTSTTVPPPGKLN